MPSITNAPDRPATYADSVGSLSVIIPLFNEETSVVPLRKRLMPVLEDLRSRWAVQVILVDDGSTDRTHSLLADCFGKDMFEGADTIILRHAVNRGLMAALASGFSAATGDIVCTMDSDCTYAPEKLGGMVDLLLSSDADIVTGSPYHPKGAVQNVKPWRLALSRGASTIYRVLAPTNLYCYTSMFRAYRRKWARPPSVGLEGYVGITEILLAAAYDGAKVVEYPVALHSRTHGESKMRVTRVIFAHLKLMARVLWLDVRGLVRWGEPAGLLRGGSGADHGQKKYSTLRIQMRGGDPPGA